jgi:hypothetical protein
MLIQAVLVLFRELAAQRYQYVAVVAVTVSQGQQVLLE